jgi:endonuclease/exonuclease/phosphatase (EEP) superfamily protein YafD
MVSNVLQPNRSSARLVSIVKDYDPDILVAVETDRWWTTILTEELGDRYPYIVSESIDNTYGITLMSKLELIGPEVGYLVVDTVPSILTNVRLPNGEVFRLYSVHPLPPLPGIDTEERDAELLIVAKMVKKRNDASIVLGDLNDVAWSETTTEFQEISSMLDPRRGRGMFNTFHADHCWLRYPLDHIFHTDHFRLVSMDRLPAWGSDHFPIGAELSYEPENQHEQNAPDAESEDHREAVEKIEEGVRKGKKVES